MANLQLIKKIAESKNIALKSVAQQAGITEQQIHMICRTNSTKVATLEQIAAALGVSPRLFFDDEIETDNSILHKSTQSNDDENSALHFNSDKVNSRDQNNDKLSLELSLVKSLLSAKDKIISELEGRVEDKIVIIELLKDKLKEYSSKKLNTELV